MTPERRARLRDAALAAAVLAFGVALCLHRGRVGYMPLDQSIVWDAGWRMLRGQVPLRDFSAPAGFVPGAMQALAFAAFGVSWLVYVAHAAVLNGVFGVLVQGLLRLRGAGPWTAASYGLLSTAVFYPPFGVPYLEQHAFFFSLVAMVEAAAAVRWPRAAALVGPALVLAALSKPIPTAFFAPIALVLVPRAAWTALGAGAFAAAVAGAAVFAALGMDPALAREALLALPAAEGAGRWTRLTPLAVPEVLARWSVFSLLALALVRPWRALALPGAVLGASLLFALLTNNQPENAAACLFLVVGLAHAGVASPRLGALVLAVAVLDAVRFDQRVNATRLVHSLQDEPTIDARAELPPEMAFLRWRLHFFYRYTPAELGRLVAYLRGQPGGVFLLGDSTVAYALAGKDSSSPVLWLHRRLTTPARGTAAFAAFEERLRASLRRHAVRLVVLEGRETYDGVRASRLPVVEALVSGGRVVQTIGPFTVVEVKTP